MPAAGDVLLSSFVFLISFGLPRSGGQAKRQGATEKSAAVICAGRCGQLGLSRGQSQQFDKDSVDKTKNAKRPLTAKNLITMKTTLLTLIFICGLVVLSKGQANTTESSKIPTWTEVDREYLLDNLIRSKEEIIAETKKLFR